MVARFSQRGGEIRQQVDPGLLAPHRRNRERLGRNGGLCKRRSVVERTFSWLHSYRRLQAWHEFHAFIYDGFPHLACALITTGQL